MEAAGPAPPQPEPEPQAPAAHPEAEAKPAGGAERQRERHDQQALSSRDSGHRTRHCGRPLRHTRIPDALQLHPPRSAPRPPTGVAIDDTENNIHATVQALEYQQPYKGPQPQKPEDFQGGDI